MSNKPVPIDPANAGRGLFSKERNRTRFLDLLRAGMGRAEARKAMGIKSEHTLHRYYKQNPEFVMEMAIAEAEAQEPVVAMLRKTALDREKPDGVRLAHAKEYLRHQRENRKHSEGVINRHLVEHRVIPATNDASIAELEDLLRQRKADDNIIDVDPIELENP